ncbi:MAG: 4Fe-4S binding protein [Bacteroidota bacterium]|nr:4Fe-4S binding protein [Bacteroidota bacterium]
MKRQIVNIDEDKCNGCGLCVPNCHEGALQIIDGKARLVSDLMCDGLGACIGYCPQEAITIEEREAEAYNEVAVISDMIGKGKNTVIAHLKHLKDHNEIGYLKQGVSWLKENEGSLSFPLQEVISEVHNSGKSMKKTSVLMNHQSNHEECGCPGAKPMSFAPAAQSTSTTDQPSALSQWPVQMHLIHPMSSHFEGSDFILAADCTAFTLGNFHSKYLKGKTLGIACPKLDSNKEVYLDKLQILIDEARINTLTVMIMEVPCCGGLLQLAQAAAQRASRKIPIKLLVVGIRGEILSEEWV